MTEKKTTRKAKTEDVKPEVPNLEEEVSRPEPPQEVNVVEVIVKEEPPESNTFVYLGPNLRSGVLRRNQIFKGGKPTISGFTDVYPMANELFVPINDRLEAMKQINKKGTLLNLAYENIKGV